MGEEAAAWRRAVLRWTAREARSSRQPGPQVEVRWACRRSIEPGSLRCVGEESPRKDTLTFEAPHASGAGQRHVLVVDDDEALARAMKRVLEGAGYAVTTAHDGNAAIATVQREPFDVIVSDIHMPGMTGVDLLRVVRAYDLDVPVILVTGEPTVETAMDAVSLGAMRYLPKPTPNDVLLGAVERASRLHRIAQMKREALVLRGDEGTMAGDRAGLESRFERALETMWMAFQPIVDPLATASSDTRLSCAPGSRRCLTPVRSSTPRRGSIGCPISASASVPLRRRFRARASRHPPVREPAHARSARPRRSTRPSHP